jgi:hypothetical protein
MGGLGLLLLLAEVAVGLSLDEADLNRPLLKVPDQPPGPTPGPPTSAARDVVRSRVIRPRVQRLLDSGLTADTIAARTGSSASDIDNLLRGTDFWIPVRTAQLILAIEVPPST